MAGVEDVWESPPAICDCCDQPTPVSQGSVLGRPPSAVRLSEQKLRAIFTKLQHYTKRETNVVRNKHVFTDRIGCAMCCKFLKGSARAYCPELREDVILGPYCLECLRTKAADWPPSVDAPVWVIPTTKQVVAQSKRVEMLPLPSERPPICIELNEPLF